MARITPAPTLAFWNFAGFAIAVLSIGASISMIRSNGIELEMAQYKLKTTSALTKMQSVSNTLNSTAKTLPLTSPKRQKIERELSESNNILERAIDDIDEETKQLVEAELEK